MHSNPTRLVQLLLVLFVELCKISVTLKVKKRLYDDFNKGVSFFEKL